MGGNGNGSWRSEILGGSFMDLLMQWTKRRFEIHNRRGFILPIEALTKYSTTKGYAESELLGTVRSEYEVNISCHVSNLDVSNSK